MAGHPRRIPRAGDTPRMTTVGAQAAAARDSSKGSRSCHPWPCHWPRHLPTHRFRRVSSKLRYATSAATHAVAVNALALFNRAGAGTGVGLPAIATRAEPSAAALGATIVNRLVVEFGVRVAIAPSVWPVALIAQVHDFSRLSSPIRPARRNPCTAPCRVRFRSGTRGIFWAHRPAQPARRRWRWGLCRGSQRRLLRAIPRT